MVIQKCKICGEAVQNTNGSSVCVCASCGSRITVPLTDDDKRMAFHNSGVHFRRLQEFDRALDVYHRLLSQDDSDAEAHWGAALCRYGIVFEKNEAGEYVPNVTRPSGVPFAQDPDCAAALQCASSDALAVYTARRDQITSAEPVKPDIAALLNQAYVLLDKEDWPNADELFQKIRFWEPDNSMAALGRLLAEQKCRKPVDLQECPEPFDESECYREALRCADADLAQTLERFAAYVRQHTKRVETRAVYKKAVSQMKKAKTEEEFRRIAAAFSYISDYHDSAQLAEVCWKKADSVRRDGIYRAAVMAMNEGSFAEAAEALQLIPGWRDADSLLQVCREKAGTKAPAKPAKKPAKARNWGRIAAAVTVLAIVFGAGSWLLVTRYIQPMQKYHAAEDLLAKNERAAAIDAFRALGTFRDCEERIADIQQTWYAEAETLLSNGDQRRAAFAFGGLQDYEDAKERSYELWESFAVRKPISAGGHDTIALRADGMAVGAGRNDDRQRDAGGWLNVMDVSAGWSHSVALRKDGSVTWTGYNGDGRSEVDRWRNVVSLSAGEWHTVGLLSNGRVIAVGFNEDGRCDVEDWRDVIAVSAGRNHTVALRLDGTVLAAGDNAYGQCNVSEWNKVIAVSAGGAHTVALRADGTILVAGSNEEGQLEITGWKDLVQLSAGYYHTVGLKADGTVVAAGWDSDGQCSGLSDWKDVVSVSAGGWHTVGLRKDGTAIAAGKNDWGQCDTAEWEELYVPATEEKLAQES